MAYYEHLPIYKKAMEVAVYFENIVKNFSRYNKYTLGSELRTVSRDIVKLIIKANSAREKLREIFAADFRDPIVHHILVDYLEKIWEPKFIFDSYACRKNKGIHLGVKRLRGFLRKITSNGSRGAF